MYDASLNNSLEDFPHHRQLGLPVRDFHDYVHLNSRFYLMYSELMDETVMLFIFTLQMLAMKWEGLGVAEGHAEKKKLVDSKITSGKRLLAKKELYCDHCRIWQVPEIHEDEDFPE